jgi:2,4-dienoyl-CoA reductase-like NADH-dependent reductase (Old Yellow Enzyme family)/thioredoxin reductase
MDFPHLFAEGRIGNLKLKNRIVMAPMVRNYADEFGFVTPKYEEHIAAIARGGVGMMILEASFVSPDGRGFLNELGIASDESIDGLRTLVQIAHEQGAAIGPQLYHAGRQTSSQVTGTQPVAPSPIPDPTIGEVPHELSVEEIHALVGAFAAAARRAKEAGCDFVEIHGAHGYLITQFLSEFSNKRYDAYGGSEENRMRFLEEVVIAVQSQVGEDFPVTTRLSGNEMVPDGIMPDYAIRIAQRLEDMGIDAVHISAGNYASYELGYMIAPMAVPEAPLVDLAEVVRNEVSIPVIAVGKIRTPDLAEDVLAVGKADFIAFARPFLADPDWPKKAKENRTSEINKCITCNQGCITRLFAQQDVWCTVNPQVSREQEFHRPMPQTGMRILVAGGGPAGMEAAKVAAQRGHNVILCESEDHLGGQLNVAAAAPYRQGWEEFREFLIREINRLGVDVRLNTRATADLARQEHTDVAIVAIGSSAYKPNIPGVEDQNVVFARDVLDGRATARGTVVVAGGGCAGAQTAEFLAIRGFDVTIIEMLGSIAIDAPGAERELLLGRLEDYGVQMLVDTKILSIHSDHLGVQSPQGLGSIPADTVVLCMGSVSNDSLAEELRPVVAHVITVGDAVEPRKVTEAVAEGAIAALSFRASEQQMAA